MYLLLLATANALRSGVPQDDFLHLLLKVGAENKLQRLADVVTHMDDRPQPPTSGDPVERGFSYVLVTTMGEGDDRGLEAMSLTNSVLLDFQLVWNDLLNKYMPAGFPGGLLTAEE